MRLLCELFLIALLIWFGWDQSFHAWTDQWRGIQRPPNTSQTQSSTESTSAVGPNAPRQPVVPSYRRPPIAATTPSGQWMWDPTHRGTLDRPAHDSKEASQDYKDAGARNYWIDGQGIRHSSAPGAMANPPPVSPSP